MWYNLIDNLKGHSKMKNTTTKKTITKKTPPKPLNKSNKRFADFYYAVASNIIKCEPFLIGAKLSIDDTDLLKPNTKKALLKRIKNIFAESNAILTKIGQIGKVK